MSICSFLCMRVHVYVNNVRLFGRFCCVNVLFYVICYWLFYVSIFVSFVPNLQGDLYALGCACVSVVFYGYMYMCMLTMCVCLVGFVVLTHCSIWLFMCCLMSIFSSAVCQIFKLFFMFWCVYVCLWCSMYASTCVCSQCTSVWQVLSS